jgi:hypothetical protein
VRDVEAQIGPGRSLCVRFPVRSARDRQPGVLEPRVRGEERGQSGADGRTRIAFGLHPPEMDLAGGEIRNGLRYRSSALRAAASRAIGTRYGEHET